MCEIEAIEDEAALARHIKAPFMLPEGQEQLTWPNVFEFPGGQPESLFWLKYISLAEVHAKGCEWQREKRKSNPKATYRGAVLSNAERIRSFKSVRGHGFALIHHPREGRFHVHISLATNNETDFNRQDKSELRYALAKIFDRREDFSCS